MQACDVCAGFCNVAHQRCGHVVHDTCMVRVAALVFCPACASLASKRTAEQLQKLNASAKQRETFQPILTWRDHVHEPEREDLDMNA